MIHKTCNQKYNFLKQIQYWLFVLYAIFITTPAYSEDVVLQLKWENEFQFAGFYAADWQNYYQEKGLNVEIKSAVTPDKKVNPAIKEIESGRAQFAIGSLDILTHYDSGSDLLILAPIFQKSPTTIVTRSDIEINAVNDLIGLKVALGNKDYLYGEMMTLFRIHGVDPKKIDIISKSPTIKRLASGEVDAIVTYGVSAKYEAQSLGFDINVVDVARFGGEFYGDVLYTHKDYYLENPQIVKDFVAASIKGWEYALTNKTEIANKISDNLPRYLMKFKDTHKYNLFFADYIDEYIRWPEVPLGSLDFDRWIKIKNDLKYLGIIENDRDLSELFINDPVVKDRHAVIIILLLILLGLIIIIVYYLIKTTTYRVIMTITLAVIGVVYYFFEENHKKQHLQNQKIETLVEIDSIKSKISGQLNSNISLLQGLASFISNNLDLTEAEFNAYCGKIINHGHAIMNIAAAKDLVVNWVYPLKGNKGILGIDYNSIPSQIDMVKKAVSTNELILAGPVNLVQGGEAIIARKAIYDENEPDVSWGVVSVPMDIKVILSEAGAFLPNLISELSIRKAGDDEKMIHGNSTLFEDDHAVMVDLNIADVVLEFAARPKVGWELPSWWLLVLKIIPLFLTAVVFYFFNSRFRQYKERAILKKTIQSNENLLMEVGSIANIGGWRIDPELKITQWTASQLNILGSHFPVKLDSVNDLIELFPQSESELLSEKINQAIEQGKHFDIELKYHSKTKKSKWVRIITNDIVSVKNGFEVTGAIQEISYYKQMNELVEYQANHDHLTGLKNRFAFQKAAKERLNQVSDIDNNQFIALFIDIDDFKIINDTLGHEIGDRFLISISAAIQEILDEGDILARYSGDEFVVMAQCYSKLKSEKKIQKILKALSKDVEIEGINVQCSSSIGVSLYPEQSRDVDDLISKADMAMYYAKSKGKNSYEYFTPVMLLNLENQTEIKTSLKDALANNELDVYLQPIVDFKTKEVVKFEALIRWYDDLNELFDTEEFIDVAEKVGLITDVDLYVLDMVYQKVNQSIWSDKNLVIAINVSAIVFNAQKNVINAWIDKLSKLTSLCEVTIEITEKSLLNNPKKTLKILKRIEEMGVVIAIDDFGIGYSSLNYLTQFPIKQIKIDREFTKQIGVVSKSDVLIKSIISLAHEIDIEVIVEGIENKEQIEFLLNNQCHLGQGFLMSKALPFDEALKLIGHKMF